VQISFLQVAREGDHTDPVNRETVVEPLPESWKIYYRPMATVREGETPYNYATSNINKLISFMRATVDGACNGCLRLWFAGNCSHSYCDDGSVAGIALEVWLTCKF